MYMEKMAKELKNIGFAENERGHTAERRHHTRNERTMLLTNRRNKSNSFFKYRSW